MLSYTAITSLDGYTADEHGRFDWSRRTRRSTPSSTTSSGVTIGGAELAGHAIRAGLVDELRLFVSPVVVGGSTPALPDGVRWQLELVAERTFGNGVVYLRYRATGSG